MTREGPMRHAVFASVSDIFRGGMRGRKYEGRGIKTQPNGNNGHCAIVIPDFFTPYRERLENKDLSFRAMLRDEALLEPEHIDKIVIHGSLSNLRDLWSLGNIPDGIFWIVNANGALNEAIQHVSEQRGGHLYVVMSGAAPQAIGLMISSWEEEGEIIIPSNSKMAQVHPEPEVRTSLRPVETSRR
ncbi:MAG: hypothetical protein ACYCY6_01675 [Minisyncoccota bacterium]